MFEIIISVALYLGAIALLVKGAFAYCNQSDSTHPVTEP